MDVLTGILNYAWDGVTGLWPYLMAMPLSLATALGFTALVLVVVTWILVRITKAAIPGRLYGFVVSAIVVTWIFVWFATQPWGAASDFSAGVGRVASLVAVFWAALLVVQSTVGRRGK